MKTAVRISIAWLPIFAVGCAMKQEPEGLRVTIQPAALDMLKKELTPILLAKGFVGPESSGTDGMIFILGRQPTSSPHLLAWFARDDTRGSFVIGKITADFTAAEVAIIDECTAVIASRLLLAAEATALQRGCIGARLGTFDFQARDFYERHGYTVFATLTGFPPGHSHLQLQKHFGHPKETQKSRNT